MSKNIRVTVLFALLLLSIVSREFLNKINYVEIGGIEFKKHNDQYYFIEMSPRTEGFLPISDMAGVLCAKAALEWDLYESTNYADRRQQESVKYVSGITKMICNIRDLKLGMFMRDLFDAVCVKDIFFIEVYFDYTPYLRYVKELIRKQHIRR